MNLKQKLVWLLSDPNIPDNEFKSVKAWLIQGGIRECLRDVEDIRTRLRSYAVRTVVPSHRAPQSVDDEFVSEVDRLLRVQANMTAREALEQLADLIGFQDGLPQRISFADGVRRMAKEVGKSNLLHAAYELRNKGAPSSEGLAWPLDRE